MIERIKELAEQAGYTEAYYESDDGPFVPSEFDKEKFAELIAKECILLAMHQHTSKSPEHYSELNEYDKGCDDTASAVASNIRLCFGVKD
jgi:hypothetical protein